MAALPEQHTTVRAIDEAVAANVEAPRAHLGASVIGRPCERALWYSFRWLAPPAFSGRMLRLFDRGRREEAVFASLLRQAGSKVILHDPATGQQLTYSAVGGHFGGSLDGLVQGLVEAPATWHVFEAKTHSAKSFADLARHGVEKSKPEHWAQVQCYMAWSKLDRAYYLAVNKDTDELYGERVKFDRAAADRLFARAEKIIAAPSPPARISDDPSWYQCKMCDFREHCHGQAMPAVSCRTCLHATPEADGAARWSCAWHAIDIPVNGQREACSSHRFIPALMRIGELVDADPDTNTLRYRLPDGREFANGAPARGSYTSAELSRNGAALLDPSIAPTVAAIRQQFGVAA